MFKKREANNNMNISFKLMIIEPKNTSWDKFEDLMIKAIKEMNYMKNKVVRFVNETRSELIQEGKRSNEEEFYVKTGFKNARDYGKNVHKEMKGMFNSNMVAENAKTAMQNANNKFFKQYYLEESPIEYTSDKSLTLSTSQFPGGQDKPVNNIKPVKDEKGYYFEVGFFNREAKKKNDYIPPNSVLKFYVSSARRNEDVLNNIINKKYEVRNAQITKEKKRWFLILTCEVEKKSNEDLGDKIMGIDLGINTAATGAIHGEKTRFYLGGSEIRHFRAKVEARRRQMLKQTKWRGEGRRGHGKKCVMKPLEKLKNRVEDFKNTTNHKYSKYIIDQAVKNGVGKIVLEDLSGINQQKKDGKTLRFLQYWPYYDLKKKIEYKANAEGIEVVSIDPKHTSARCNKCGHIHRSEDRNIWRKDTKVFKCMNCNHGHEYRVDADYNAAQNIATPGIEDIITEHVKERKAAGTWEPVTKEEPKKKSNKKKKPNKAAAK